MKITILEDPDPDYPFLPEVYLAGHTCRSLALTRENSAQIINSLAAGDPGVIFNLCDGSPGEDRPGVEVVQALERHGLPFTGADSVFYAATRARMRSTCEAYGVPIPPGVFIRSLDDLSRQVQGLRYPLLVKHPNGFASVGLLPESRVSDFRSLRVQVERIMAAYGEALVEEFIEGREFSVLMVADPDRPDEPRLYQPIEFLFPPGESFKHEELKWVTYEGLRALPVTVPELAGQLKELSKRMYLGLKGSGHARCDLRGDKAGNLYMLEINPNCGIFYPPDAPGTADHILHLDGGHAGFVELLLRGALARNRRSAQPVRLKSLQPAS